MNTYGGLICLSDRMPEKVKFKKIECGYSHALLIDEIDYVYAFGAGLYGQLGLGCEELKAKYPVPVTDVNDDIVLKISCGAHFSLCYSELGIIYYWGMLIPDDFDSINWIPNFMSISLPKHFTHEQHLSFGLSDICASFREVLACDLAGRVYHCDLNSSQTLKPYDTKTQQLLGAAHHVKLGRGGYHLFLDTLIDPAACGVVDCDEEMETLTEGSVTIKLIDTNGESHFVNGNVEELIEKLPIRLVFNSSENMVTTDHMQFDFKTFNGVKEENKDNDSEVFYVFSLNEANKVKYKLSYSVDEDDHSLVNIKVVPMQDGEF